jgi:glucose-1-phosphate thymidylyltransferase
LKAYEGNPLLAAYDIRDREKAKQLGTVIAELKTKNQKLETCHVTAFEEKPKNPRSTLVSTGCFLLPASVLPALISFAREKPDNIGGIFEHFLAMGTPVDCKAFVEPWFDIGSFEAYLEATKALVGENVLGAPTDDGNVFEGSVVLGKGSKVLKSTLKNVVLFDNCTIDDCILENCILDNGCTLKGVDLTGKMLRENTTLIRD